MLFFAFGGRKSKKIRKDVRKRFSKFFGGVALKNKKY